MVDLWAVGTGNEGAKLNDLGGSETVNGWLTVRLMTHAAFYLMNDLTQMGNLGYRRLLESHAVRQNGERIKGYLMIAFALQIHKDRG